MKAIFIDRDGVINQEKNYLYKIEDFVFIDGVFDACQAFQKMGFALIIITNQAGIAKGYYNKSDYNKLTDWVLAQFKTNGINILDVFYCPHDDRHNCQCRKPKPGMFLNAQKKYAIDMAQSWMIGDKENDITAANRAGVGRSILVRSGHNIDEKNSQADFILDSIKQVVTVL